MLETDITIKTDNFDGPMGLLLLLIQKEEMSIQNLNINQITEQYLNYLERMEKLNFDIAGDYLFMAATLVLLKSKACVSPEDIKNLMGDEIVSEHAIISKADLIRRLEELERFQQLSKKLWELPRKGEDIFVKPKVKRKEIINSILPPMELTDLTMSMMDYIQRERRKYKVVKRDRLSIKEKLVFLKSLLKEGTRTTFEDLVLESGKKEIEKKNKRTDMVITFISLLELARLKQIEIFQNETKGTIYLDVVKSLEAFDVDSADGFEVEGGPSPTTTSVKNLDETSELMTKANTEVFPDIPVQ